jgi:hypothetical protein
VESAHIKPGDAPMHHRRKQQRIISILQRLPAGPHALLEKLRIEDERRDQERHGANKQVRPEGGNIEPAGAPEKQQRD